MVFFSTGGRFTGESESSAGRAPRLKGPGLRARVIQPEWRGPTTSLTPTPMAGSVPCEVASPKGKTRPSAPMIQ